MVLSITARAEFFRLRNPFLAYCNGQLDVHPKARTFEALKSLGTHSVCDVAKVIRRHPEVFDCYARENPQRLGAGDLATIMAWKNGIQGKLIVVKLLKKGAILAETSKPLRHFLVVGLTTPVEDFCPEVPVMIEANLLPFAGQIVPDGFVDPYAIHFGGGIKKNLNEAYQRDRQAGKVWTSLLEPPNPPPPTSKSQKKADWNGILEPMVQACEQLRGAETEALGSAFSLLRASAQLALLVANQSEEAEIRKKLAATRRAFTAFQHNR